MNQAAVITNRSASPLLSAIAYELLGYVALRIASSIVDTRNLVWDSPSGLEEKLAGSSLQSLRNLVWARPAASIYPHFPADELVLFQCASAQRPYDQFDCNVE